MSHFCCMSCFSEYFLMLVVVLNIPHGPDKEVGLRYAQFKELLLFLFANLSYRDCELFLAYGTKMLAEMRADVENSGGEFDVHGGDDWARLWQYLKSVGPLEKSEYKVNFVRFMAFTRALKALLSKWTLTLFKCELVALELDMLNGKAFKEQVMVKQSLLKEMGGVGATEGQTASDAIGFDAQLLRSCCQNALVIGCMVLGVEKLFVYFALTCPYINHEQCCKRNPAEHVNMFASVVKMRDQAACTTPIPAQVEHLMHVAA